MDQPTRGEIEASFVNAITQFEKDHLGRGPLDARVFVIQDMALIRLRGVLTPAEIKLAQTADGQVLVKQIRMQLLESSRTILEEIVQQITGCGIVSLHSDISVKTGERVIIFTLNQNLEERFEWSKGEHTRR